MTENISSSGQIQSSNVFQIKIKNEPGNQLRKPSPGVQFDSFKSPVMNSDNTSIPISVSIPSSSGRRNNYGGVAKEESKSDMEVDMCEKTKETASNCTHRNHVTRDQEKYLTSRERALLIPPRPSRQCVLRRLSEALMRRSLTMIDLSQKDLRPTDAKLIKLALLQNESLTILKLGYNGLGDEGVSILASGIASHKSLQSLDLGFNGVGDAGVHALVSAFSRTEPNGNRITPSLQTLYLSGNLIGERGAMSLAYAVREGCCLRRLHLTGNKIGSNGIKFIAQAISEYEQSISFRCTPELNSDNSMKSEDQSDNRNEDGMQELYIGGTGVGPGGCLSLLQPLEASSSLRVLSLANCGIGDQEIKRISHSIMTNCSRLPLESLQLSFNNLGCDGVEALMCALWKVKCFRELRLDNNCIGDQGAQMVAHGVSSLGIEVLDLGFNPITPAGVKVLMKSVAESDKITSLTISGIPLDTAAAKNVAYGLVYNHSLKSLFLDHCSIGHAAQRHITAGIVSNSNISLHSVTGFCIGTIAVTLGMPSDLEKLSNEQVLKFIHLMWQQMRHEREKSLREQELDPLFCLESPSAGSCKQQNGVSISRERLNPAAVIAAAKKTLYSLRDPEEADKRLSSIFHKRSAEPPFESPLSVDAVMMEANEEYRTSSLSHHDFQQPETPDTCGEAHMDISMTTKNGSEISIKIKNKLPPANNLSEFNGAKRRRNAKWLQSNNRYLNELGQVPFDPAELWQLHQHFFSPIKTASGDVLCNLSGTEDPDKLHHVSLNSSVASAPGYDRNSSSKSREDQRLMPVSDTAVQRIVMLPMLRRKVSYHLLNDALSTLSPQTANAKGKGRTVSSMIEEGMQHSSMQPKSKRARGFKTRIAYVPRVKAKVESYLESDHYKALVLMRQLKYIESAFITDRSIDKSSKLYLSGLLARDAEMILLDMK